MRSAQVFCAVSVVACGVLVAGVPHAIAAPCGNPNAIGTSRTLVVDPTEHPRLGAMQYRETLPLADHEVVLTFDDGPLPPYTNRILDILASECVKATYFLVGRMARAHPQMVARIASEGHTIGTHSQNHPFTFHKMGAARAQKEVQAGIASVAAALGRPPAPFFRIPGLLRASSVEGYLASRHLMTWSADIASDDWRRISDKQIVQRTISRLEARGRGMILMHDIHPRTVLALPVLLRELKARGYRIVHVVPATRTRIKTATLPSQWRSRTGSHPPRIAAPRLPVGAVGSDGAWPKTLATPDAEISASRHKTRRAGAAVRQPRAHVAVAVEDDKAEADVAQPPEPRSLLSGLLRLPMQVLR